MADHDRERGASLMLTPLMWLEPEELAKLPGYMAPTPAIRYGPFAGEANPYHVLSFTITSIVRLAAVVLSSVFLHAPIFVFGYSLVTCRTHHHVPPFSYLKYIMGVKPPTKISTHKQGALHAVHSRHPLKFFHFMNRYLCRQVEAYATD